MSEKSPLSDNQAHDLLTQAADLFADRKGTTVRAETALRSAEKMLTLLSLGLLMASEMGTDDPVKPPSINPPA
jgi:hypothetical protein